VGAPDLARNITLPGHTDQGGRGDGVQVMVGGGYAYVGHMFSKGVTVLDVRDPRHPKPVNYLPAAPGTWNLHLQLAEGLLLVVNAVNPFAAPAFADESSSYGRSIGEALAEQPPAEYRAGMAVYDLADPAAPREIGVFVPPAPERLYDTRPNRPRVIQSCDVFADRDGVLYVTDYNAGLYTLQYEPGSS
jgi:hypothetical protein